MHELERLLKSAFGSQTKSDEWTNIPELSAGSCEYCSSLHVEFIVNSNPSLASQWRRFWMAEKSVFSKIYWAYRATLKYPATFFGIVLRKPCTEVSVLVKNGVNTHQTNRIRLRSLTNKLHSRLDQKFSARFFSAKVFWWNIFRPNFFRPKIFWVKCFWPKICWAKLFGTKIF